MKGGRQSALRERVRARSGTAEVLVVRVGGERFGVELAAVEEALDVPLVHHVPEMPPAMRGVITVRGMLTSVFSPERALGVALRSGGSALVFRRTRGRVALLVDEVDDVMNVRLDHVRTAPALDGGPGVLIGVVRHADALLALVDSDALLAACQAVPALETA